MRVIIMQGCSGAGKSTWIKRNVPEAAVVSADHYFMVDGQYKFDPSKLGEAHAACMRSFVEKVYHADASGLDTLVVDNTNTTQVEMAPYVAVATAFGCEVDIVRCIVSADIAAERNVHGVPAEAVKAMKRRMQEPAPFWKVSFQRVNTRV